MLGEPIGKQKREFGRAFPFVPTRESAPEGRQFRQQPPMILPMRFGVGIPEDLEKTFFAGDVGLSETCDIARDGGNRADRFVADAPVVEIVGPGKQPTVPVIEHIDALSVGALPFQ
jgi:hypothetical protein